MLEVCAEALPCEAMHVVSREAGIEQAEHRRADDGQSLGEVASTPSVRVSWPRSMKTPRCIAVSTDAAKVDKAYRRSRVLNRVPALRDAMRVARYEFRVRYSLRSDPSEGVRYGYVVVGPQSGTA